MGNALRVAALATLVAGEIDDPMRDPASWGAGQCVAYLFLQGEQSMALSDVWQEYLNSCPPGSYTVHAHLQHEAPFPTEFTFTHDDRHLTVLEDVEVEEREVVDGARLVDEVEVARDLAVLLHVLGRLEDLLDELDRRELGERVVDAVSHGAVPRIGGGRGDGDGGGGRGDVRG